MRKLLTFLQQTAILTNHTVDGVDRAQNTHTSVAEQITGEITATTFSRVALPPRDLQPACERTNERGDTSAATSATSASGDLVLGKKRSAYVNIYV